MICLYPQYDTHWTKFSKYFDRVWLAKGRVSTWNVERYKGDEGPIRTSNGLEIYNRWFNGEFPDRPTVASFVHTLRNEAIKVHRNRTAIADGHAPKPIRNPVEPLALPKALTELLERVQVIGNGFDITEEYIYAATIIVKMNSSQNNDHLLFENLSVSGDEESNSSQNEQEGSGEDGEIRNVPEQREPQVGQEEAGEIFYISSTDGQGPSGEREVSIERLPPIPDYPSHACVCECASCTSKVPCIAEHQYWVRCDFRQCYEKWFHLSCVGLLEAPSTKWYCAS